MKNTTIENQQGNNNFKKGYLIGMLDGEGTISLSRSGKTNTPPLFCKLQPYINISGTDKLIMDKVIQYCKDLNLPIHIRTANRNIKHKPVILVQVYGLSRVEKWIQCFSNIDFGKKEKLDLLNEYIQLRKDKIEKHPFKKPYSKREIEIYNAIRMLNERGGKSRHLLQIIDSDKSQEDRRIWHYNKMIELIEKGWSQTQIANFFGIDQSSISKWIKRNYQDPQRLPSGHSMSEGIVSSYTRV